jgi:hypothetical protein
MACLLNNHIHATRLLQRATTSLAACKRSSAALCALCSTEHRCQVPSAKMRASELAAQCAQAVPETIAALAVGRLLRRIRAAKAAPCPACGHRKTLRAAGALAGGAGGGLPRCRRFPASPRRSGHAPAACTRPLPAAHRLMSGSRRIVQRWCTALCSAASRNAGASTALCNVRCIVHRLRASRQSGLSAAVAGLHGGAAPRSAFGH